MKVKLLMRVWGLLRKETLQILRDPSSIAIAFVMPVVLLFIFGYGVSLDAERVPVALVVDGAKVTSKSDDLAKVAVTGEVLEHTKGPKIRIHKFKNKTGYHRRMRHRQPLTQVKVTGIESGK